MSNTIIAIDGPAGSGKSTIAKRVAKAINAVFLDTGAIYRSVALSAKRQSIAWDNEDALAKVAEDLPLRFVNKDGANRVFLGEEDVSEAIRTPEISKGASDVSAYPNVRSALLEMQQRFGREQDVVAEGRDIGTVVFPQATLKVFLVASEEARAKRRLKDFQKKDPSITLEDVLAQQKVRDTNDSGRKVAPLVAAKDAVTVDSSDMAIEEVVSKVLSLLKERK